MQLFRESIGSVRVICLLLASSVALMPISPSFAQPQIHSSIQPTSVTVRAALPSLDLTSTSATMPAVLPSSQTLNVGGSQLSVHSSTLLTPAEFLALQGLIATGHQSLVLGTQGQAVGGSFTLTRADSRLFSLVIPSGVSGVAAGNGTLQVVGGLTDAGSLLGMGNVLTRTFTLHVGDLAVNAGGLLGTTGTAPTTFNILSDGNITNAGTISSTGLLNLNAAGNIANSGTITAGQGINLFSGAGNITNTATISSTGGNILLNTIPGANLDINNIGGQILATAGNINFRLPTFHAKLYTDLIGGTLSANALNFNGGNGTVNANVDQVDGIVNVNAGIAHVTAAGGTLNMGTVKLTGDPTFVNTAGDVNLHSNIILNGSGIAVRDVAIIASGNVNADGGVTKIDVSNGSGNGGNVTIIAGATISGTPSQSDNDTTNTYSVTALNSGNVNLPNVSIKSTGANGNGGSVLIAAPGAASNLSIGSITTSASNGNGGGVALYATKVQTFGGIDTHASGNALSIGRAGDIDIESGPTLNGTLSITNGTVSGGSIGHANPTAPVSGSTITVGNEVSNNGPVNASGTTMGGNVTLICDGDITATNLMNVSNTKGDPNNPTSHNTLTMTSKSGSVIANGDIDGDTNLNPVKITISAGHDAVLHKSVAVIGISGAGDVTISIKDFFALGYGEQLGDPVVLNPHAGIKANGTSSASGGGNINITCDNGPILIANGIDASGALAGGSVNLTATHSYIRVDGPISTSAKIPSGGNFGAGEINLTAGGGNEFNGVEVKGAVTAVNGVNFLAPTAANIDISSQGAVFLRGGVATSSKVQFNLPGTITVSSVYDTNITGNVDSSGQLGGTITLNSSHGMVNISKNVNASGIGEGGTIHVTGQDGVNIGGNVTSQSTSTQTAVGGGTLLLDTVQGAITVKGNIITSAANTKGAPGTGGSITVGHVGNPGGASLIQIGGSVNSNGSSSTNGSGGVAGSINIQGVANGFGTAAVGTVIIGGSVTAIGGNTNTGTAGPGGTITLVGATVQVKGNSGGASINASPGKGGTFSQPPGTITIVTYGIQPLTTDFNLPSTKADQPVLPGSVFIVGDPSANGTKAAVVSGLTAADKFPTGKAVFFSDDNHATAAGVEIDTGITGGGEVDSTSVKLNGALTPFTPTKNSGSVTPGTVTLSQLGARNLATPGEALALFELTRPANSLTQHIGLTSLGAVDVSDVNGSFPNTITIDGIEFGRPLSAFNIAAAGTPQSSIRVTVNMAEINGSQTIDFPLAKANNILSGELNFFDKDGLPNNDPKLVRMDMNAGLTITRGTALDPNLVETEPGTTPVTLTLDLRGSGGTSTLSLLNAAFVNVPNVLIRNESGNLTINMSHSAEFVAPQLAPGTFVLSASNGTLLNSNLTVKTDTSTTNLIQGYNVSLLGKAITVGTLNNTSFATTGPNFSGSQIVDSQSIGNTLIASVGDLTYSGTVIAAGNFTTTSGTPNAGNTTLLFNNANVTVAGNAGLFTSGNLPNGTATFTNSTVTVTKALAIDAAHVTDGAGTNNFTAGTTVQINGDTSFNLSTGINNIVSGGNLTVLSTSSNGPGSIAFTGTMTAGTSSTGLPDTSNQLQGLPHSFVKTPGQIALFTEGSITIGNNSQFSALGASIFVQAGDFTQTPGPLASSVTLGNNTSFTANGGNVSITAIGNINGAGASTGNTFSARGFTSGGAGGVEILAGTANTLVASKLATRPTPLLETDPSNLIGTNVTVISMGTSGTSKGLIDLTGEGGTNLSGITINLFKSVALLESLTTGTAVNLTGATITAIDPVAYSEKQPPSADDLVVDSSEDAGEICI